MSLSINTDSNATRQERSPSSSSTASTSTATSQIQTFFSRKPTHHIAPPHTFLELTPPLSPSTSVSGDSFYGSDNGGEEKKKSGGKEWSMTVNYEERQRLLLLRARDN